MVFICAMTIWILTLILLASLAGLGYRQGAVRVAFSLVGILVATLFASLLAKPVALLLPHLGVHNPVTVWFVSPFIVFVIVLAVFKFAAFYVHRKIDLHFHHKTSELQQALWKRLNHRLGLCLGTVNALLYLILLSFVIYNFSYWTTQVATSDEEPWSIRWLNRLGGDMGSTGLAKVARSVDPLPELYFKTADLAGLLYQNPQLKDRLSAYPAFISLSERDDFKQLGQDADFQGGWKSHSPIHQLINAAPAKAMIENPDTANSLWNAVKADLDDLTHYLQTGESDKYADQKLVGRWDINISTSFAMLRQARPNIPSTEMKFVRAWMMKAYADTTFVAGTDGQAFLKNLPRLKGQPPTTETATWTGQWKANGDNYDVTLASNGENKSMTGSIAGSRLTLKDDKNVLVFDHD